eukprot:jgi/Tetstr1/435919/TSEL_024805.t1
MMADKQNKPLPVTACGDALLCVHDNEAGEWEWAEAHMPYEHEREHQPLIAVLHRERHSAVWLPRCSSLAPPAQVEAAPTERLRRREYLLLVGGDLGIRDDFAGEFERTTARAYPVLLELIIPAGVAGHECGGLRNSTIQAEPAVSGNGDLEPGVPDARGPGAWLGRSLDAFLPRRDALCAALPSGHVVLFGGNDGTTSDAFGDGWHEYGFEDCLVMDPSAAVAHCQASPSAPRGAAATLVAGTEGYMVASAPTSAAMYRGLAGGQVPRGMQLFSLKLLCPEQQGG